MINNTPSLPIYPVAGTYPVKTETEVFDRRCFYIILKGKIYCKPIAPLANATWREISFPKTVTRISTDGDLLVVVDEDHRVYQTKTQSIDLHVAESDWKNTPLKLEWRKPFSRDRMASVLNFFKSKSLHMLPGARAIAVSHSNKRDPTNIQEKIEFCLIPRETTFYMLNPSGNQIFFSDSRVTNKFCNEILGPEKGTFISENMAASGSTLFLIQRAKSFDGKEIHKIYTRHVNPVAAESGEGWFHQPSIPLADNARLTKRITILQTGKNPEDRQLRAEGTDQWGHRGYYVKSLQERAWTFQRTNHYISESAFLPREQRGSGLVNKLPPIKSTPCPKEQSPSCLQRIPFQVMFYLTLPITFLLNLAECIFRRIFFSKSKAAAKERLLETLRFKDNQSTSAVIKQLVKKNPSLAPPPIVDFLCSPLTTSQLRQLMRGANVRIRGDRGQQLFQVWTQLKGAEQRISSHAHKPGTSYAVETPLFGELLFWKDEQGHLRLQFEGHSLNSPRQIYYHLVDYLRYKMSGKQQGPYGSSKHIDSIPIDL